MSQLILDDQLSVRKVLTPLQKWITVERLQDLRSGEVILDDRVPEILRTQKNATFVTIDQDFWARGKGEVRGKPAVGSVCLLRGPLPSPFAISPKCRRVTQGKCRGRFIGLDRVGTAPLFYLALFSLHSRPEVDRV